MRCVHSASVSFFNCHFEGNVAVSEGGAVTCQSPGGYFSNDSHFYGCVFAGNGAESGGAVAVSGFCDVSFEGCLFFENSAVFGGALYIWAGNADLAWCTMVGNSCDPLNPGGAITLWVEASSCWVEHSILALNSGGTGGGAVGCCSGANATLICSDVYGNTGGDWVGCIAGQFPGSGNLNEDPLFCGEQNPGAPYSLDAASPCALAECGLMGAFPAACGDYLASAESRGDTGDRSPVSASPNPSRGSITVSFARGVEFASVSVHDAVGRLVGSLGERPPGPGGIREVVWDAQDANGAPVCAGVYFIRWRLGAASGQRSVVILR